MNEPDKNLLVNCITTILVFLILVLAILCLILEKRNIEKEIILKQIEVYGEPINQEEKK